MPPPYDQCTALFQHLLESSITARAIAEHPDLRERDLPIFHRIADATEALFFEAVHAHANDFQQNLAQAGDLTPPPPEEPPTCNPSDHP